MFVLKYVCIKICLFLIKNNKKTAADRPTDLGTVAARAVGRSVGRFFLFVLVFFIYKQTFFNEKQTYFKTNIF